MSSRHLKHGIMGYKLIVSPEGIYIVYITHDERESVCVDVWMCGYGMRYGGYVYIYIYIYVPRRAH